MDILELFRDWENKEQFTARSVIYSEDDPADTLFVILSGEIELSRHGEVIGSEKAGALIGEMAMIDNASRNTTATATTDVTLARLDKNRFRELVDQSSAFSLHAMAALAERLRSVDRFIAERIKNP